MTYKNILSLILCLFINLTFVPLHTVFGDDSSKNVNLTSYPGEITINPVTNTVYVSNSNYITIINGTANTSFNIKVGDNLDGISVNPVTDLIYATDTSSNTMYVIDGHTYNITNKIPLPIEPGEISVNPNTNMIYVIAMNGTKSGFFIINGTTNEIMNSILGLGNSKGISVNPVTNEIYINNFSLSGNTPHTISVIDGVTNKIISTIILDHNNCLTCTMPTSTGDMPIAINPITNIIYAGDFNSGKISVINGSNNEIMSDIALVGKSLSIDTKNNLIYVSGGGQDDKNGESHYVSVINGSKNVVINTILSGGVTHRIAVNSITGIVYSVNSGPISSVTIMDYNPSTLILKTSPEFPFAMPMFMASIASLIILYRIKFKTNI